MPWKHFKRLFSRQYKETGLYGNVWDFSVDFTSIAVNDILDTDKYLMKKNGIV